jgi:hypothetical protein
MDYSGILKRAWNVTWRHKALWVLGFFVGGGAAGSGGSRTTTPAPQNAFSGAAFQTFVGRYAPLIAAAVLVAVCFAFIFVVISIAARGGLIHLVNEAEEGRPFRLRDGWRAGFSKWWRMFGVTFLAGLPVSIVVAIIFAIVGVSAFTAIGMYFAGGGGTPDTQTLRTLIAPLLGASCFIFVLAIVAVFLGVVFGITGALATRYVMLEDRRVMESLKQGWNDLWHRRGSFVMFLLMAVVGIIVGIVFSVVWGVFSVPALMLNGTRVVGVGTSLTGLASLLLIVPAAIYGTFIEAAWTVFFRRMTGLERPVAVAAPVPAGAYPAAPAPYGAPPAAVPYAPVAPFVPAAPAAAAPPMEPMPAPEPMPTPAPMTAPAEPPAPMMPAEPMPPAPEPMPPAEPPSHMTPPTESPDA